MVAHALTYWPSVGPYRPSLPQPPNLTSLTLLATGYFSPGCHGGGADSAHHFGKPGRASFKILTSFEKTPLILHGRRPRIQKMKCLAQKLTKWRRIEKLWWKRRIDRFRELKDLVRFALCKFPTHRRQSGSHFAQGGPILPKLVSMAS